MRTAREVPTPLLCRNSMISRITCCSAQPAMIRSARFGPIPLTSRSRLGLLRDDLEHGLAKGAHQLFGIDRADAADHPGAQIFLDPLDRGRRRRLEKRGSELDAVGAVVDPAAARLNKLAGRDHRGMADHGDQIALPARFDPQNAKAVLRIVKCDAVDETGQDFRVLRFARPPANASIGKSSSNAEAEWGAMFSG